MNRYLETMVDAGRSNDRKAFHAAVEAYMQAAASALSDVVSDFGGNDIAPLIVVVEYLAESLKAKSSEHTLRAAEALREKCVAVTIPGSFGRHA